MTIDDLLVVIQRGAQHPARRGVLSYAQSHHDLVVSCHKPGQVPPGYRSPTWYYVGHLYNEAN
jgi:hypothetical protein